MAWNPAFLISVIDLVAVIAAVTYFSVLLYRRRMHIHYLGLDGGIYFIFGGLMISALLYIADRMATHVLPAVSAESAAVIRWLSTWGWVSLLAGIACLLVGLVYLVRARIPRATHAAQRLQRARLGLEHDLRIKGQAEMALAERNGRLELHVREQIRALAKMRERLAHEVDERRRSEAALRDSEKQYRALYHENPLMIFIVDRDGSVISANESAARMLGRTTEDLRAKRLDDLFQPIDRAAFIRHIESCHENPGSVCEIEVQGTAWNGRPLWFNVIGRAMRDPAGNSTAMIVCEDIAEFQRLSRQLKHQADHDVLTGLVNRREFEHRLERVIKSARHEPTEYAICYLDLDKFKDVNDTCGHAAGDELLRQLGDVLRKRIRARDTVARLGGDEFAVLLEHCSAEQAQGFAEDLCHAVHDFRFAWDGKQFDIGVSIGLVPVTGQVDNIEQLLRAADAACYAAKEEGRNRVHVYRDGDKARHADDREEHGASRIRGALDENRLRLFYQPIYPMRVGGRRGRHYEVLLRVDDHAGNPLSPGAFVHSAERHGLAPAVDRWVVTRIIDWLAMHPAHLNDLYLASVNLSGASLADDDFMGYLEKQLSGSDRIAAKLCFEITETVAIESPERTSWCMTTLGKHGCRFALDDFGGGASSLEYLQKFPLTFVKIAGTLITNITRDTDSYRIVDSISETAAGAGVQTVAGCVENQAIYEKLFEIGVSFVQGFGLAEPRPLIEPDVRNAPGSALLDRRLAQSS